MGWGREFGSFKSKAYEMEILVEKCVRMVSLTLLDEMLQEGLAEFES